MDRSRTGPEPGQACWLAGVGIRGGVAHGATDEWGFHAVERRHYVQLGMDARRLALPGRKRLEIDLGQPIRE